MKTADQILRDHGIATKSTQQGRYYTTCPKCSHTRKASHRKLKCLGVTIDAEGVVWGCNHCPWTGGMRYENSGTDWNRGIRAPQHIGRNSREVRNLYR